MYFWRLGFVLLHSWIIVKGQVLYVKLFCSFFFYFRVPIIFCVLDLERRFSLSLDTLLFSHPNNKNENNSTDNQRAPPPIESLIIALGRTWTYCLNMCLLFSGPEAFPVELASSQIWCFPYGNVRSVVAPTHDQVLKVSKQRQITLLVYIYSPQIFADWWDQNL